MISCATVSALLSACWALTPGFSRPTIRKLQFASAIGTSSSARKLIGTHSSERFNWPGFSGNSKFRGITPITIYGSRSSRILVPRIRASR
jgi:hypothetical protein